MTAPDAPPSYSAEQPPPPPADISLTLTSDPTGKEVLISVIPPNAPPTSTDDKKGNDELKRAAVDFVLTIDVSGSMASNAPVPGDAEYGGLSVLDVVKHAAKTIIMTMKDDDRVAIVAFSGAAKTVLPLTNTTEAGKKDAIDKVETLRPLDSTNIWDGLKTSMNILTGAQPATGMMATLRTAVTGKTPITHNPPSINRLSSIFLLTDGMPNINPPRGHIPMLKMYLESHPPNFTINTFGFGYSLDSPLLHEIAKVGGGHFGFIPDSGMVGTVFVHAVANTYATYAGGLFVDIEVDAEDVAKNLEVVGAFDTTRSTWGVQVPLGALQYGQSRDLVVKLPRSLEKAPLTVTARCSPWNTTGEVKATRVINASYVPAATSALDQNPVYHNFRLTFVDKTLELFKDDKPDKQRGYSANSATPDLAAATTSFKELISSINAAFPNGKAGATQTAQDTLDLVEDIEGQVLLGVADSTAYNRWGRHYLLSLSRSHQRQQCGNFKDPGLQGYGRDSPLFKTSRDAIDKTFDDLPPPTPAVISPPALHSWASGPPVGAMAYGAPPAPMARSMARGRVASGRGGSPQPGSAAPPPPTLMALGGPAPEMQQQQLSARFSGSMKKSVYSMSQYNQRSAPCFAGDCSIDLADGSKIAVQDLHVGASVKTPAGSSKVVGIVKTVIDGGRLELCKIGDGLVITPWHPIFLNGAGWQFPADIVEPEDTPCEAVYSILLEKGADHAVFIGGVQCVTLGHGVVGDEKDARSHPFLSDYDAVVAEMQKAPGSGVKTAIGIRRDAETGLMCGFTWAGEVQVAMKTCHVEVIESEMHIVPAITITA